MRLMVRLCSCALTNKLDFNINVLFGRGKNKGVQKLLLSRLDTVRGHNTTVRQVYQYVAQACMYFHK